MADGIGGQAEGSDGVSDRHGLTGQSGVRAEGAGAEGERKSRWMNEDDPMTEWTN